MARWQLTEADVAALIACEPRMAPVVAHFGLITRNCYEDSFSGLARIIIGQQLSGSVAQKSWEKVPKDAQRDPAALKALLERGAYLSCTQGKRKALYAVASGFVSGQLSHELLLALPKEQRRELLLRLPGIGPWSCDMFDLMVARERDCLPLGDLGIVRGLKLCLGIDLKDKGLTVKERRRMEAKIRAQFSPVGTFAAFYLWEASNARFSPLAQE